MKVLFLRRKETIPKFETTIFATKENLFKERKSNFPEKGNESQSLKVVFHGKKIIRA
jgi:hypothetical protein